MPPIFFKAAYIDGQPDKVEEWLDELRAGNHQGTAHASRGVDNRDDVSDRTPTISVPTLVIHGTEDAAIEMDRAEALASRIPGARLETVEGAGHQSNVDSPDEISRLLRGFLAEIRQRAAAGSAG
jgi:pimeloyl-ACP methyl ester carboxylesterase